MDIVNILFILIVIVLTSSCVCSIFNSKMDYLDNSGKLMLLSILVLFVLSRKVKVENFMDFQPLNYEHKIMGDYDNIDILKINKDKEIVKNCGWRKPPCNVPLVKNARFYPAGACVNLEPDEIEACIAEEENNPALKQCGKALSDDISSHLLPPVDGNPESRKKMFMFAYNKCSPECCPSTYTCDRGCVCTTAQQRKFINKRGNNKSKDNYQLI